ncbi:phage tail tape measure protein [Brevibacillus borstelensis]|uniref:phage tail tape measure protein n=1 Tax=Brevibacillus borstelensis TaxID=45462 RepID=UPI0020424489|nr:phage tail tape measure protein [Brevibacillus borstelensis]MCM3589625.1 phage tail tape measure protein [Brevibacillus borstelensis]
MLADIEVGDLVARITLDDTGLDKSMAQIQREMKLVASEFEKASASLEAFGSEEDKLRAKNDQLTKQMTLQGQKIELLRQEFKKAAQEKGEDAVATQKLATQLNKAEAAMARMQTELKQVNKELADQPSRMANWSKGLQDVGNRLQSIGSEIATAFGLAGAAVTAGLAGAVKTAADFEAQMDRVGAIAEATAAEIDAMSKSAMELGASSSKSASEVAQGMEMMAAMGFQANEIIAAMPGVIAAAEASGEDMALVADTMAVSIRAFGLEAKQSTHVADVLSKTANISAANLQGMAYALKYAAAPAHTLGMSLEELSAAVAIMSDAGIRGETAGTTLRMALTRLAKPTDEAAEVLNLLGVKINDANGNMLPFSNIVGQLKTSMDGLSNSQKAAYLATIFGVEAMSGMMTIIEAGPAKLQALTKELQNSSGASAEAAAKMKDNLKGALEQLSGAFETMQITIGNALIPVIQSLAGALQSVVEWFNQLNPKVQEFVVISAAVGAALLTLIGVFGAITAAVGLAATGLGALGLQLSTMAAAILPVTAAIAGLTAAGILLYQNWDTIKAYATQVWGEIRDFIKPAVDEVASFISETFGDLAAWWKTIWPDLQKAFTNIWDGIVAYIGPKMEIIKAVFEATWPYVKNIVVATWEAIKSVISASLDIIKGLVEVFVGVFTGDWHRAWEGIKTIVSGAWQAVHSIISSGIQIVLNLLGSMVASIAGFFTGVGQQMVKHGGDIVRGLGQGIMDTAEWLKTKVLEIVNGVANTIKNFFGIHSPSRLMAEYGGYLVEGLWQGIQSMAGWIKTKVTEFSADIANTIKSFFGIHSPSRLMAEYGGYIAEGLAVGMRQNEAAVANAAKAQADIVKKKTEEAKNAAIAHWKEMNAKVKTEADLMAAAVTSALTKVREMTNLELEISRQKFELFASTLGTTTADEAKKLEAQMELLRTELATSNETVDLLKKAYDDMAAAKGANSVEAQKLYLELLKEQTAYQGIKKELSELEKQYEKTAQAARNLVIEQGKIFENINGNWVESGRVGERVGADDPIYGPGGDWADMPDWLKPTPSSGGSKEEDSGRKRPKDTDREGAYQKDVDKDNFGGSANTNVRKAAKEVGDSIRDAFDKVKESFRFPGLATGGTVSRSGWTWVGEKGPELLNLPRGSQVIPNYDLPRVGSSSQSVQLAININGPVYGIDDLNGQIKRVVQTETLPILYKQLRQPARAR